MALLLDTQILIWLENYPSNISEKTLNILLQEELVYFSDVSLWEIAIKIKTGKLQLKNSLENFINNFLIDYKFHSLPIIQKHIYQTEKLDLHHRDPFDRLLIAQSIVENIPIISSDSIFDKYIENRIW
jgi:PIN domain nuclease of toxin-antitoxin system